MRRPWPLLIGAACATVGAPVPTQRDVLRAALPGVVLVLAHLPDGHIGYGSGVLLDGQGSVLTNLHVVAGASSLGAMLYDPNRVSYIPQEGGLARYLFEHEADISGARLVRADPGLDLAVLHVEADTAKYARLRFRDAPVQAGEKVIALGHPAETVWTFTTGVVSSLHSEMIQTDAAINTGNSGGPLIDERGELVGINTSKLVGGVQGIGFARPVAMVKALVEGASASYVPDRSTPAKAVLSCARAYELASPSVVDCDDFDSSYELAVEGLALARRQVPKGSVQTFDAMLGPGFQDRRAFIAQQRSELAARVTGETHEARAGLQQWLEERADGGRGDDLRAAWKDLRRTVSQMNIENDAEILRRTGKKVNVQNPRSSVEILRMGLRVDAVGMLDGGRAWVAQSGRNIDATPYRTAELWVERDGGWCQRQIPEEADVAERPSHFPLPEEERSKQLADFAHAALESFRFGSKMLALDAGVKLRINPVLQ